MRKKAKNTKTYHFYPNFRILNRKFLSFRTQSRNKICSWASFCKKKRASSAI